jgi:hypothetical protein
MQSPRSLLLITVDCFRADRAGFLGYRRSTTPFLDSLARESLVFSNAMWRALRLIFLFLLCWLPAIPSAWGETWLAWPQGSPRSLLR